MSISNELTNGEGITLHISRGESLISAIKDNTTVSSLHSLADLLPLLLGGIHASRVVSASMEQEGRLSRSILNLVQNTVKVQSVVGIQISVLHIGNSSSIEHTEVVGPSGIRNVNTLITLHVLQEISNQTQRTSSGQSLAHSNTIFLNSRTIGSIDELSSKTVEIRKTLNRRILVITLSSNTSLSLSNAGENHGLSVVITVSTHSERDLTRILISLELFIQSKNGIWRSLSHLSHYMMN